MDLVNENESKKIKEPTNPTIQKSTQIRAKIEYIAIKTRKSSNTKNNTDKSKDRIDSNEDWFIPRQYVF